MAAMVVQEVVAKEAPSQEFSRTLLLSVQMGL